MADELQQRKPVITCIVGARPNFIKIAPILDALARDGRLQGHLVHTGQHYDTDMNDRFFHELGIPEPDINLAVGSRGHTAQIGEILIRLDPILEERRPAAVLVVGDVNSTLAASLVAVKKGIPLAHVEAGLRSFDRSMPEEINRLLTDQVSDLLFTTERQAAKNLQREGIPDSRIHFVGNVMIDALHRCRSRAVPAERTLAASGIRQPPCYAVVTLHRPSNVDDPETLGRLIDTLSTIGAKIPVIFPMHPRTRGRLEASGLTNRLAPPRVYTVPPLGYLGMLGLLADAKLVMTDSGGIQEETTALGVPCLTLRANTERPITVEQGTSTLVGNEPENILAAFDDVLRTGGKRGRVPELWDGHAAERIVGILAEKFRIPARPAA